MAHDVFISHSSKDKPIADAICAHLEGAGVRCWIAPRDIAPGEDWPTAITRAISQSRVMVLVFSTHSNSSEDVSRELFLAANSKLVIIPFKIENIEPEPGKQYYLARTHWLDAINPLTQEQIRALIDCVKALIPVGPSPIVEIQPATPPHIDQPIPGNEPPQPPLPEPATRKKAAWLHYLWIPAAFVLLGLIGWVVLTFVTHTLPVPMLARAMATETATTIIPVPEALTPTPIFTAIPVAKFSSAPNFTPTSTAIAFADDFSNTRYDGRFDTSQWSTYNGGAYTYTTIQQENGVMLFTKPSITGAEPGNLITVLSWSPEEFSYVEARLKVNRQHKGDTGNIGLSLATANGWSVGCGFSVGTTQPTFFCNQIEPPYTSSEYYQQSSTPAAYDQWYTVRIEIDPQTFELTFYIDGQFFDHWRPANANQLFQDKFNIVIGMWTDNGTSMTGSVDDVKVVK